VELILPPLVECPFSRRRKSDYLGRKKTMASRTLPRGLASVFSLLWLVYASGGTIASSTELLACDGDSTTACFDFVSDGANISHIFIDVACAASVSDYAITVDGEPVTELYTDDGPCESIPREVWFTLHSHQDTAHVCVSIQGAGPEDIQVYAKAGRDCIAPAMQ
jgi:hypothetical protein